MIIEERARVRNAWPSSFYFFQIESPHARPFLNKVLMPAGVLDTLVAQTTSEITVTNIEEHDTFQMSTIIDCEPALPCSDEKSEVLFFFNHSSVTKPISN